MEKPVITVDVDEVLFPFLEYFLDHNNPRIGSNLSKVDFEKYIFHETMGLSRGEADRLIDEFTEMEHSHIEPIEGSIEIIGRLALAYDLEIVTARGPEYHRKTEEWLHTHMPAKFRGLNCIGFAERMANPITKASVCQSIGAIAHIDDSITHVRECAEVGIEGLLFGDYSWNQIELLPTGVVRLKNWQAVAEHFNV